MASSTKESIIAPFHPRRALRGGHIQTLASFCLTRRLDLPPSEERMVAVEDGAKVLCHCHWQAERTLPLTIIIVHGLEGSSDSGYMRGVALKGLRAGMNVVRVNQRNCGGTEHLSPTLYNSSLSRDIAAVAACLIEYDQISRFALAGFSMGGNLVLKLAGEWGSGGPKQFCAVAAVCPAMDLAASADALHERQNFLYERYFMWKLRKRFREKARLFPQVFDTSRLQGVRSLREFDDKVTAYYCGFTGASDYYARAGASNVVDRISRPALILQAANDPFVRIVPETRAKILANPHITFVETDDGGHCSFVGRPSRANPNGATDEDDGFWAESQLIEFLRRC